MKNLKKYLLLAVPAVVFSLASCNNEKTASVQTTTDIPVTSKSEEAKASFQQGLALFDEGNGLKARAMFTKAIEQDPNLAVAYLYRGNVGQSAKDFMDDMGRAKAHLDSASEWEKMYYDYQNTFISDDWNKRLEVAQKIATAYPDAARAQVDLGNTYLGGNQFDKARAAFQKATELNPKWIGGFNALANSYLFTDPKDYKKAEENAMTVVALIPKNASAQVTLGDCYRAQNDMEKAKTAYAKAIELEPDVAVGYYKRGHVNSFLGNYDEARKDYTEGAKHDDNTIGAMLNIANTYVYAGDYKTAMQVFMDNAAKTETSGDPKSKIAGEKLGYLQSCATLCMHMGDAAHLKELASMMQGPSDQVAGDIGTQEEKLVQKGSMLYWQALADVAEDKLDDAKAKAAELKTTVEPVNIPTKLEGYEQVMGSIAMKEKKYADAIGHFEKMNPGDIYGKYLLAKANEAAGNKDKANSLYKEIAAYNFNDIGNALVRNEVKKKIAM